MRRTAVLLALMVLTGACRAPSRAPDISGQITRATTASGHVTILVEAVPADASGSPKALVTVDRSTRLFHKTAKVSAQIEDLLPGTTVSVWFDGPVAESYPLQTKAGTLLIQTDTTPFNSAPPRATRP